MLSMSIEQRREEDSLRRVSLARHRIGIVSHQYSADNDSIWLALLAAPHLEPQDILHPHQVKQRVDQLLQHVHLAYWSGGFDCAYHHMLMMDAIAELIPSDVMVLLGVEPNSYIETKGRLPVIYQEDRLHSMARLLKRNNKLAGTIFLPSRDRKIQPAQHHDALIKNMGLFRRPGVFHLYTAGDPATGAKLERMLNPQAWCELPKIGRDDSMSTTRILQEV